MKKSLRSPPFSRRFQQGAILHLWALTISITAAAAPAVDATVVATKAQVLEAQETLMEDTKELLCWTHW